MPRDKGYYPVKPKRSKKKGSKKSKGEAALRQGYTTR